MYKVKTLSILCAFLALSTMSSCIKNCGDCEDNSTIWVYGGVMVGSSGSYVLEIKETDSKAIIKFDGNTYTLFATEKLAKHLSIVDLYLSDGTNSVVFSANEDGENPQIEFNIPGHQIESTIDIITKPSPIVMYEGSSSSTSGSSLIEETYNLTIRGENHNITSFTALTKTTYSSFPDQVGQTNRIEGTVKIMEDYLEFKYQVDGANETLILLKDGNKLILNDSGPDYSPNIKLVKSELPHTKLQI